MLQRNVINTKDAPGAIGPYCQAVVAGGVVYCSGQIAIDPATNEFEGGDVQTQTRRVMENLGAVLRAAQSGVQHIVRSTIFVKSMADFALVNEVYATFFEGHIPPARACVEVSALPKGALVEIDAIALSAASLDNRE